MISNSWDADATKVEIRMDGDDLIVIDNGTGMDNNDIENKFSVTGYQKKKIRNN